MPDLFNDKIAIVTGGASGIGRALCEELGSRGAKVVVADIDTASALLVVETIEAGGGRARVAQLDVTQANAVENVVSEVAGEEGRLDYIFNNAALSIPHREMQDVPIGDWHRIISVNMLGVVYGTSAAYSLMTRQGFGHIVNTASVAGLVGFPTHIPYAVTKFALVGLSTSLGVEARDLGVKVSVVCPGYVRARTDDAQGVIGPERAATAILHGVARNKTYIVFPFSARILWWLHRLNPQLLALLARRVLRDVRAKNAADSGSEAG